MTLRGEDAATIINTIDNLLKGTRLSYTTKPHAFKLMRKLAGASRQVPKSYLIGTFTLLRVEKKVIAGGGSADIRKGRLNGKDVAIKTVRVSLEDGEDFGSIHEAFCKECVVWMNMSHPNVHQLIAVKIKPSAGKFSMVSELMTNGNILNYISKKEANRIHLLEDVARGLEYLHKIGIIHGDLKGHNILINNERPPRACIADFGLSAIVPSTSFGPTNANGGGTFGYMAPELLGYSAQASKEADIYAFGMVVYEVVTGTRPFGHRGLMERAAITLQGTRPPIPEDPIAVGFGRGTWELAERCWAGDPKQRPMATQVLEHFERLRMVSTVSVPGPTIPVDPPTYPKPENSSKNLSKLFARPTTSGSNRFRQAAYSTRVLVSNQAVPVPTLQARGEPNLLNRVFHYLIPPRIAHRLAAPP